MHPCGDGELSTRCQNQGPVVSGRAEESHKLPSVVGSYFCSEGIHKEQEECPGTSLNGQQNGCVLCKPHGRYPFPSDVWTGDPAVRQWCLERNLYLSAEYLPGVNNCVADRESRVIQSSLEWQLQNKHFGR